MSVFFPYLSSAAVWGQWTCCSQTDVARHTHPLFALPAGNPATNAAFHDTSQVQSVCDRYIWCDIKSFPPDKGLQSPGHEFLSWCCSVCDWWPWRFACILSNYSESNCWKYPPRSLPLHSPLSVFFFFFLSAQGPRNVIWGVWLFLSPPVHVCVFV